MKKQLLVFLAGIIVINTFCYNPSQESKKIDNDQVICIAYAATTSLLHGIGKSLYAYSGAQKYSYSPEAILSSDLNIFTFPQKTATNTYERMGRQILTASSILHAPLRSLINSAMIIWPLTAPGYVTAHGCANSKTSFRTILWSALKVPRYGCYYPLGGMVAYNQYQLQKNSF